MISKQKLINSILVLGSVFFTIMLIEIVARIYYSNLKSSVFENNQHFGWSMKPNLNTYWKTDGKRWEIVTDSFGYRSFPNWSPDKKKKILVLGDSFAFGQGVSLKHRFDAKWVSQGHMVLNTGVMGYGTDQSFLSTKKHFSKLKNGDLIVILTYFNDLGDIASSRRNLRAKPWMEYSNDKLVVHEPKFEWIDWANKSRLVQYLLGKYSKKRPFTTEQIDRAKEVYLQIINEIRGSIEDKNVKILIAFHGFELPLRPYVKVAMRSMMEHTSKLNDVTVVNLDDYFSYYKDPMYYQTDGHWNEAGNEFVGKILLENF